MNFKKFIVLVLAFVLFESSTCQKESNPGLVDLEIELMDGDGIPIAGAMLSLYQEDCLQDTFFTNADGIGKYSFLPSADNNYSKYDPIPYYVVGYLKDGKLPVASKPFEGNGKHSFSFVAKDLKPYLSVTLKPSNADSLDMWIHHQALYGLGSCSLVDGVSIVAYSIQKILNPDQENQLVFDVLPNDTTQLRVRTYSFQNIRDTTYNIVIEESAVELIIE